MVNCVKHEKNELSEMSYWKKIKGCYKQNWKAINVAWSFGFVVWAILPYTYKIMMKMILSWVIIISGFILILFYFNMIKEKDTDWW